MALTVRALDRGGWSAHGGGHFDARANAVTLARWGDDEVLAATVSFNETISSVTVEEDGLDISTPSNSAGVSTFTISTMDTGGAADLVFTLASGEVRRLTINSSPRVRGFDTDYGR